MRVERKVAIGDRDVTVRELTVGEIRQWVAEAETAPPDPPPAVASALALLEDPADHQALLGLERMTDFRLDALDSVPPSALRALLTACREVNADFFGLLARVAMVMQESSAAR